MSDDNFDPTCLFCRLLQEPATCRLGSVVMIEDAYPVTPGHHLILPSRHVPDIFSMTSEERADADRAVMWLHDQLMKADPTIAGFNVGTNAGEAAGQTIGHAHIHVIPRRLGDTPSPRGGVRGVVPERMQY